RARRTEVADSAPRLSDYLRQLLPAGTSHHGLATAHRGHARQSACVALSGAIHHPCETATGYRCPCFLPEPGPDRPHAAETSRRSLPDQIPLGRADAGWLCAAC